MDGTNAERRHRSRSVLKRYTSAEASVAVRLVLAGVLVFGLGAIIGVSTTNAVLADAHGGTANVSAIDDFGKSGPTADAGGPYSVTEGNTVGLDGSGSSTSQGNIRDFSWQISSGPGSLSGANSEKPTYHAPSDVDQDTEVTVELTVTDNKGNSRADRATITVTDSAASDAPAVNNLNVARNTQNNQQIDISTSVSDPTTDADTLDRVEIVVRNTKQGTTAYSSTTTVSGDSASVTDTTIELKNKKDYRIIVTVFDSTGDTAQTSQTMTTG